MTKNFATSYSSQNTIDFRGLSNAQAGDWVTLTEHQHLEWGRFVSEWGGHVFDPTFQTSSTGLTYSSSSTSRDLSEVSCAGIAEKRLAGGVVRVGAAIFGKKMTVQVTLTRLSDGVQLAQFTASTSTSQTEWAAASADIAYSEMVDGSGVGELIDVDLQAKSADGTTADLYEIRVGEIETADSSDLPRRTVALPDYKGLTSTQMNRMRLALREDTLVDGSGYPARQSEIDTPSGGATPTYWTDATDHRVFFSSGGDTVTYQSSAPSGLVLEEPGEELFWVEQGRLDNTSADYHSVLHDTTMTLGVRCSLQSIASDESDAILATGRRSDSNVFWLGYQEDGAGNTQIRALLKDGGTTLYDETAQITTSASALQDIWLEHDAGGETVTVHVDGTDEIFAGITGSLPSSATPDGQLTVGAANSSSTTTDQADIVVQGVALDTRLNVGDELTSWISGNDYTG